MGIVTISPHPNQQITEIWKKWEHTQTQSTWVDVGIMYSTTTTYSIASGWLDTELMTKRKLRRWWSTIVLRLVSAVWLLLSVLAFWFGNQMSVEYGKKMIAFNATSNLRSRSTEPKQLCISGLVDWVPGNSACCLMMRPNIWSDRLILVSSRTHSGVWPITYC